MVLFDFIHHAFKPFIWVTCTYIAGPPVDVDTEMRDLPNNSASAAADSSPSDNNQSIVSVEDMHHDGALGHGNLGDDESSDNEQHPQPLPPAPPAHMPPFPVPPFPIGGAGSKCKVVLLILFYNLPVVKVDVLRAGICVSARSSSFPCTSSSPWDATQLGPGYAAVV